MDRGISQGGGQGSSQPMFVDQSDTNWCTLKHEVSRHLFFCFFLGGGLCANSVFKILMYYSALPQPGTKLTCFRKILFLFFAFMLSCLHHLFKGHTKQLAGWFGEKCEQPSAILFLNPPSPLLSSQCIQPHYNQSLFQHKATVDLTFTCELMNSFALLWPWLTGRSTSCNWLTLARFSSSTWAAATFSLFPFQAARTEACRARP